jgi:hypothetical protein
VARMERCARAAAGHDHYYQRAREKARGKAQDFTRLFRVPGAFPCERYFTVDREALANGGPGAYQFNWTAVLQRRVEGGIAPDNPVELRLRVPSYTDPKRTGRAP